MIEKRKFIIEEFEKRLPLNYKLITPIDFRTLSRENRIVTSSAFNVSKMTCHFPAKPISRLLELKNDQNL